MSVIRETIWNAVPWQIHQVPFPRHRIAILCTEVLVSMVLIYLVKTGRGVERRRARITHLNEPAASVEQGFFSVERSFARPFQFK